jgi:RHS repeat-associated protein
MCQSVTAMKSSIDRRHLLLCDGPGSVLLSRSRCWRSYGAFGDEAFMRGGLGYNGIWREAMFNGYLLGDGYRLYVPALRRFSRYDPMSPFGPGGLNGYMYCAADPINFVDPSGKVRFFYGASVASDVVGGVPTSITGKGAVRGGLSFSPMRGSLPFSTKQAQAVEAFKTTINHVESGYWNELRATIESYQLAKGGWQLSDNQQRLALRQLDPSVGLRWKSMFPDNRPIDGRAWGQPYFDEVVSDDTVAMRVIAVERDRLRAAGVDVHPVRFLYKKNPAPKRRVVMR